VEVGVLEAVDYAEAVEVAAGVKDESTDDEEKQATQATLDRLATLNSISSAADSSYEDLP
jgi:hypothetical protein